MVRKMILRSLAVVVMVASTVVLPGCDEGKNDNDFVVGSRDDGVENLDLFYGTALSLGFNDISNFKRFEQ